MSKFPLVVHIDSMGELGKIDYSDNPGLVLWLLQHKEQNIKMELSTIGKESPKQKMFNYYHGPFLDAVTLWLIKDCGYEQMDEKKAHDILISECGTNHTPNPLFPSKSKNQWLPHKLDMSKCAHEELKDYIDRCMYWLKNDMDFHNLPDSEYYNLCQYFQKKRSST